MSQIDKQFIQNMKKKLIAHRNEIEDEMRVMASKKGIKFPDYGDKEDENAQEVSTFFTRISVSETLDKELRDINKALKAIEDGNYGICKYCDQLIDNRRLEARPTSTSCVECKTKLKRGV